MHSFVADCVRDPSCKSKVNRHQPVPNIAAVVVFRHTFSMPKGKSGPPQRVHNWHFGICFANMIAHCVAISDGCCFTLRIRNYGSVKILLDLLGTPELLRLCHSFGWRKSLRTEVSDDIRARLTRKMRMLTVAFYDTKPYDRRFFDGARGGESLHVLYYDFRLSTDTAASAEGAQAVCVFVSDKLDESCLAELHRRGVKLVALRCAGFNNVDLQAAKALGLVVVRVPAYSPHAVAEHAIAILLTLNRKIHRAFNRVREQNFSLNGLVGFDLHGKTIGIVGTGAIGKLAASIFLGFGTRVLASDPYPSPEWADQLGARYVSFNDLLEQSDIVSLHLPLTQQSYHMFDAEAFARMKPTAYLVNTSRGKLIDSSSLIEVIKSGRIGGVALDVYEEEEGIFFEDHSDTVLQDAVLSRLLSFPNVLITSHQAFLTHEALTEIARLTTENLRCLDQGIPFIEGSVLVDQS